MATIRLLVGDVSPQGCKGNGGLEHVKSAQIRAAAPEQYREIAQLEHCHLGGSES